MLDGIASALPANDARLPAIRAAAAAHREAGLKSVTGEHYEGGHWLGSFAVYLTTKRGTPASSPAGPQASTPARERRRDAAGPAAGTAALHSPR
jgi:hypothetical protein